jgi:hypothetical protein
MSSPTDFQLEKNAFGRLVLTEADGKVHEGVVPVRNFPIGAPDTCLSLMGTDGHELAWIARLADLPPLLRQLIEEELAQREFVPQIRQLMAVSSFSTPSTWQVETDRGPTDFVLKGEEDIRRLPQGRLLIADSHGMHYLLPDVKALDRASRKLLDRFL